MRPQRFKIVIDGSAENERAIEILSSQIGSMLCSLPGWEPKIPPVTYYMLPDDAPLGARLPEVRG